MEVLTVFDKFHISLLNFPGCGLVKHTSVAVHK